MFRKPWRVVQVLFICGLAGLLAGLLLAGLVITAILVVTSDFVG